MTQEPSALRDACSLSRRPNIRRARRQRAGGFVSRLVLSAAVAVLAHALVTPSLTGQGFDDIHAGLTDVHHNSALWGDVDGDGDLDVFLNGQTNAHSYHTGIWRNTDGVFSEFDCGIPATAGSASRARSAWGDYDNDGDLDIVVLGYGAGPRLINLYRNGGGGGFTAETVLPAALTCTSSSSVSWGDIDNDGDLDIIISSQMPLCLSIQRNDGSSGNGGWVFKPLVISRDDCTGEGDCAFADYDNDGDLDFITTGNRSWSSSPVTKIFQNVRGTFYNSGIIGLPQLGKSSVAWGDYNNDSYPDLAVSGVDNMNRNQLLVLHNNSGGSFSTVATLAGVNEGSLAWGDYNNDGKFDLLVTGSDDPYFGRRPTASVYYGDGSGAFTVDANASLDAIYESQAVWGDYDNDGHLDILAAGNDVTEHSLTTIYHNVDQSSANSVPAAPGSLSLSCGARMITATWTPGSDAETPTGGLTYNMMVRDQATGALIMSPMANEGSGYRYVAQIGNVNHNLTWTITGLAPGHQYSVCVQTIDGALAGSSFACGSITTNTVMPDVMIADCLGDYGSEPDWQCNAVWNSPSIYVRTTPDGLQPNRNAHQTPMPGQPNWIYVKLTNIGNDDLRRGRVYVYFSKASTSITWPYNWINCSSGNIPYGDLIGSMEVSWLGPQATTTVEIPWTNVPNPADYNDNGARHFCLLARFVSDEDPMTEPETRYVLYNTRLNNNIAWKNLAIYMPRDHDAPLDVAFDEDDAGISRLVMAVPEEEEAQPITDHMTIQVDLGPELFGIWSAGDRVGTGVQVVTNEEGKEVIQLNGPTAEIGNLRLATGFRTTIRVKFLYPDIVLPEMPDTYGFMIKQYNGDENVGAEAYEVHTRDEITPPAPKRSSIADRDASVESLQLTAHPNPTTGSTVIAYTLVDPCRVTLVLCDAAGRQVATLVNGAEQNAGRHEVVWNGTSADGKPVADGTYFYSVETPLGKAAGQIRIVR